MSGPKWQSLYADTIDRDHFVTFVGMRYRWSPMPAFSQTPVQGFSTAATDPVFVDPSGRRLQRLKKAGMVALGLMTLYVVLLLVAFLGGSTIAAPMLPVPGGRPVVAAGPEAPTKPQPTPGPVSERAGEPPVAPPGAADSTEAATNSPERTAAPAVPSSATESAAPSSSAVPREATGPQATPSTAPASATPTPGSDPATRGKSLDAPGRNATAPGHSDAGPAKPTRGTRP